MKFWGIRDQPGKLGGSLHPCFGCCCLLRPPCMSKNHCLRFPGGSRVPAQEPWLHPPLETWGWKYPRKNERVERIAQSWYWFKLVRRGDASLVPPAACPDGWAVGCPSRRIAPSQGSAAHVRPLNIISGSGLWGDHRWDLNPTGAWGRGV